MHRGIFILIIARGKRAHYGAHSIFACIISNTIITICDTRQPEERERERERSLCTYTHTHIRVSA